MPPTYLGENLVTIAWEMEISNAQLSFTTIVRVNRYFLPFKYQTQRYGMNANISNLLAGPALSMPAIVNTADHRLTQVVF